MLWNVLGLVLEVAGLGLTAWGLVRAWRSAYGDEFYFLTNKRKDPVHYRLSGVRASGALARDLPEAGAYTQQRLRRLETQMEQLRDEFNHQRDSSQQQHSQLHTQVNQLVSDGWSSAERLRVDTRLAALGLFVIGLGTVAQFIGVGTSG